VEVSFAFDYFLEFFFLWSFDVEAGSEEGRDITRYSLLERLTSRPKASGPLYDSRNDTSVFKPGSN
jgi:hypothetical protein